MRTKAAGGVGSRPQCDAVRREMSKQRSDMSLPAAMRIAQGCRVANPIWGVVDLR
jgi:hypothetical protein